MKINRETKFLIAGLGLIGGSYADALSRAGYEVGAVDICQESIDYAIENNIISHGFTEIKPDYLEQFDIVIIALYPHAVKEWIEENQKYLKRDIVITDVTGVKAPVVYSVQEILRNDIEFIAAHPMAGKELSGVKNADGNIFKSANYIITPTEANSLEGIEVCKDVARILHFKTITKLTPEKHDEMIAFLSQLTHCIAVSLMTCRESEHFIDYTGDSFRDLTRIAKINDTMWPELFISNKDQLINQMNLFIEQFCKLKEYILNDDIENLQQIMKNSTIKRELFDQALE